MDTQGRTDDWRKLTEEEEAALQLAIEAASPHLEGLDDRVLAEYAARMGMLAATYQESGPQMFQLLCDIRERATGLLAFEIADRVG